MAPQWKTPIFRPLPLLAALWFASCQSGEIAGGLETTNGVTVAVSGDTVDGSTGPDVQLFLCDNAFRNDTSAQPFSDSTISGRSGLFRFFGVPAGKYNLLAWNRRDSSAVVTGITVGNGSAYRLDAVPFTPDCTVRGKVSIEDQLWDSVAVFLLGTPLAEKSDSGGTFNIAGVPQGKYLIFARYIFLSRENPALAMEYITNMNVEVSPNLPEIELQLVSRKSAIAPGAENLKDYFRY